MGRRRLEANATSGDNRQIGEGQPAKRPKLRGEPAECSCVELPWLSSQLPLASASHLRFFGLAWRSNVPR
eukprot:3518769-Karenia_brevis.AAC.1